MTLMQNALNIYIFFYTHSFQQIEIYIPQKLLPYIEHLFLDN